MHGIIHGIIPDFGGNGTVSKSGNMCVLSGNFEVAWGLLGTFSRATELRGITYNVSKYYTNPMKFIFYAFCTKSVHMPICAILVIFLTIWHPTLQCLINGEGTLADFQIFWHPRTVIKHPWIYQIFSQFEYKMTIFLINRL